jgi:hypothetical protein
MREHLIERPTISAVYLLAEKPSKHDVVVIPEGFVITKCPTRTASGAHRTVRGGSGGDTRPPITPTNILRAGYANRGLRGYAATR